MADFQYTREYLASLRGWLGQLASNLPAPSKVFLPAGGFRWQHEEKTPEVLLVCKAVRMVSGLNAAMALADAGYTTEAGSLLRTVTDFANEILAIGEGIASGKMSKSQRDFVEQYFKPPPASHEEFLAREQEYYVGRTELYKALKRLGQGTPVDTDTLVSLSKYLDKGYDMYVHGGYTTGMELYSGLTDDFMVSGHDSTHHRCVAKVAVCNKLHYAMIALEFMAMLQSMRDLVLEIREGRHQLEAQPEYRFDYCD